MSGMFELTAERRNEFGKGASRRLRRLADKVPAIMYGGGEAATAIQFHHKDLIKSLENEAFYSHILQIIIDGEQHQAVLKDLQRHPYKPRIMHMDLLRITGKEKIHMQVPLHFINDSIAPGVKQGGGIVSHLMNSIEIICLPANLPEFIEVDLANLELDQSIHLSELKLPEGVEIVALTHGTEHDLPVVNIHVPRSSSSAEETAVVAASATTEAPAAKTNPAAKGEKKGK